jgi:hypothetical protein
MLTPRSLIAPQVLAWVMLWEGAGFLYARLRESIRDSLARFACLHLGR